ncbi:hypothetical protein Tco_0729939 [Tanacetum coccineum]|uniref:Uncharacterized protein n=1 Tax=Tanacetum coccineum TaxID=301880 RepID=A0ABQ4YTF7_9ASTR
MEEDYVTRHKSNIKDESMKQHTLSKSKNHVFIKKEDEKLLEAGLIYPISVKSWVSLSTLVYKEGRNNCDDGCLYGDFSVFGISFPKNCLSRLDHMLQRCEGNSNLVLTGCRAILWSRRAFCSSAIKISKKGIAVVKDFSKYPTNDPSLEKNTPFILPLSDDCIRAFSNIERIDLRKLRILMLKWAFYLSLCAIASDSALDWKNPYENVIDPNEINESFPLETLNMVTFRGDSRTPWFADFANYHAGRFIVKGIRLLSKWVEARESIPTNDAASSLKFLNLSSPDWMLPCNHKIAPDCEDLSFVFTQGVSHPQLHLDLDILNLIGLTDLVCVISHLEESLGSGYQQKDRKPSQNDKTEHEMEKTVQNQGQNAKVRVKTEESAVKPEPE